MPIYGVNGPFCHPRCRIFYSTASGNSLACSRKRSRKRPLIATKKARTACEKPAGDFYYTTQIMSDVGEYSSDSYEMHDEPAPPTSDSSASEGFAEQDDEQQKQSLPELQSDPFATETESFLTTIDSEAITSTSSVRRLTGGVKVSKKAKTDPLFIQRLINAVLKEKVPIDAFKQDKIVTMIKNTVGIKCKQCGSDNVYVESRQVRSADEAMTKFYTCLNCGNKWRFD